MNHPVYVVMVPEWGSMREPPYPECWFPTRDEAEAFAKSLSHARAHVIELRSGLSVEAR